MLLARKRLVDTKRQFENQLRNIMKMFGCILGTTAGHGFIAARRGCLQQRPGRARRSSKLGSMTPISTPPPAHPACPR
jgi:hypothetical protein